MNLFRPEFCGFAGYTVTLFRNYVVSTEASQNAVYGVKILTSNALFNFSNLHTDKKSGPYRPITQWPTTAEF